MGRIGLARMRRRGLGVCAALVALGCSVAAAQTLVSPWDGNAPALTDVAYACPAVGAPGYSASFDPGPRLVSLATEVTDAADAYRESGSRAAAQCAAKMLSAAADGDAMEEAKALKMTRFDESETLNAAAIAYLKIWGSGVVAPEQAKAVGKWLATVARRQEKYFDTIVKKNPRLPSSHDHRLFLAGYAAMSAAIAVDDRRLYDWGVSAFHEGANQIDRNGMMVWERCSGGNTAKCHLQAAAALVMMAEYGAYNGDGLYEYKHGALHLLVKSAAAGLADPETFRAYSDGEPQHLPSHMQAWEIGWAVPYQRRFPDAAIAGLLKAGPAPRFIGWGGTPD